MSKAWCGARGGIGAVLCGAAVLGIAAACIAPGQRLPPLPREGELHEWAQLAVERTWETSLFPERLDRRMVIGALSALAARIDGVHFAEPAPGQSGIGALHFGAEGVWIREPAPFDSRRFAQVVGDALVWVSDRLQAEGREAWPDLEEIALAGAFAAIDAESSLDAGAVGDAAPGESTDAAAEEEAVSARALGGGIGYVRIAELGPAAFDEFQRRLNGLGRIGGLVIDLRGNRGGSMRVAAQIVDVFLESGTIWRVLDRAARQQQDGVSGERLAALPSAGDLGVPIAILIDRGTAAAAEVIAGALAPLEGVTLMGEQTAGKGLLQRETSLPGGRRLKLTVAEFRLSSDRAIDGVGLVPEVPLPPAVSAVRSARDVVPEADHELAIELAKVLLSEGREAALRRLQAREESAARSAVPAGE